MGGRADLRLGISDVAPSVSCRAYSSRAVVDEWVPVTATVFGEGHDLVGATVVWTTPRKAAGKPGKQVVRMQPEGEPDRWIALVRPDTEGLWSFVVEGWRDPWGTWTHDVHAKLDVGQDAAELDNDLETGARILDRAAGAAAATERSMLRAAATRLRDKSADLATRVRAALGEAVDESLLASPVREMVSRSPRHEIWVDRRRALYGAWYEFFPRSEGGRRASGAAVHGTFADAAKRLPAIAEMSFDVVYLPPIHPIGEVNRKGANNTLDPGPDDVGSPWAIGSKDGGHDAIHPALGTEQDFADFVSRTRALGMEVALDLALQCAPDHPWVAEHPEWFTTKPDGTIAYAENPPKKYQDIYPLNFDNDPAGLYAEVLRVTRLWIDRGVRIFRVDNPHTKPLNFWHWLIWEIKKTDPDVLFLAEAFTRPAMMHTLAKIGFTQSYTYFTWRTGKTELEEYGRELARASDYMRPNFFVNTPDILHASLQVGGPEMFKIRAVLASMMAPTWGVYSGYELFEHRPVRPGSEEYLDSEKYQLRPRDYAAAEEAGRSLTPFLRRLNEIRRAHPALQQLRSIQFHSIENGNLLCFSKVDPGSSDVVLVVCTLDPYGAQIGTTALDMPALGLDWADRIPVVDELTGAQFEWGQYNYVELGPHREVAHILRLQRPQIGSA
ncbi:MAG: alpha-1,4-glucan--maltose-1-phosphate maltosyltransferase [Geodermatophilaceae bacterium]|nr:alpha-1,4-glucan--maltose-1-phosphate maltosyltransferase [Geodermatophilaceae bacterium]